MYKWVFLGDISGTSDHALEVIHHSGGLQLLWIYGIMCSCNDSFLDYLLCLCYFDLLIVLQRIALWLLWQAFACYYILCAEMMGGLAGITGAYFAGLFHRVVIEITKLKKDCSFVNAFYYLYFFGSIDYKLIFACYLCMNGV